MKTIALFAVIALCANSAHAGLFARLFGCRGGSCAKPAVKAKAPQYRYECKNGVCRRVEGK